MNATRKILEVRPMLVVIDSPTSLFSQNILDRTPPSLMKYMHELAFFGDKFSLSYCGH